MEEGQNDYLLAQAVLGRKGSIYAVKDYKETWDLLEQYELRLLDLENLIQNSRVKILA